ncbi:hypothetical protein TL16_g02507 [Triparma laevis f. inornata]|uniref:Glutamyl-tRNA(Gln) amidotransferase subunit B, mitochondrial n=1 Tax=Triparma laevis f. inornata TaxID=1714386 RepID=A0A9W6ZY17_9STRA|nr:hypothetical protein TL16_g02507 [Triparma laevis f. inornata]
MKYTTHLLQHFRPVIGLEVHAQLSTAQKLFSPSHHRASAPENTLLSPFDLSIPGSLPILNLACIKKAIIAASILSCKINDESRFERKHYFYPDLPSGYQITQNRWPIAGRGALHFGPQKISEINRIQLETDTGKSKAETEEEEEEEALGSAVNIDYNRAGAPLIEIVFEPDLTSAEDAGEAVYTLQRLLKHVGVCDGKFEMGSLRCDLNVSIFEGDDDAPIPPLEELGNRVEVKNLNSIRAIVAAAKYEFDRQVKVVEGGGVVSQETRTFDKKKLVSIPMRKKETSTDYRFLIDPDIPPLVLSQTKDLDVEALLAGVPELPEQAKKRLADEYGLKPNICEILISDPVEMKLFEDAVKAASASAPTVTPPQPPYPQNVVEYTTKLLCNDIFALKNEKAGEPHKINSRQLADTVTTLAAGDINMRMAKDIITIVFKRWEKNDDTEVLTLIKEQGLQVRKSRIRTTSSLHSLLVLFPKTVHY